MGRGPDEKSTLHPRNRHRSRYDFPALTKACPALARHVAPNAYGDLSIDFADPEAVRALNRALLEVYYAVQGWDVPPGYLCPPIPGRADMIHHLADLLASSNGGVVPRGPAVRALDVGVGANAVYPLVGVHDYGWRFVGSDVDPVSLASAERILAANPPLRQAIELRRQASAERIFEGVLQPGETFDLTLCNPPFHASLADAREGSQRKWRNLGKDAGGRGAPVRNFGGQGAELWCPGGERGFLQRMVEESARHPRACLWFTTLVSKSENLDGLRAAVRQAKAADLRIIEMAQGQKKSRVVAWTFLSPREHESWRARWKADRRDVPSSR